MIYNCISRFRKNDDSITIRLFNSSDKPSIAGLLIEKNNFRINFGAFEIKTFRYQSGKLEETDMI